MSIIYIISLKKTAVHGLDDDLQTTLRSNGLVNEALTLVREYLTTKSDLAKFLVDTSIDNLPENMKMINRKLRPKLEVLGELVKRGYNPTDERTKKLVNAAPSLHELAKLVKNTTKLRDLEFKVDERKEIHNLSKADSPVNIENEEAKKEREEKRKEAKKLMEEAKKLASENLEKNKKQIEEKIKRIKSLVELPKEWNQVDKDSPEDMLDKLNIKVKEMGEFQESCKGFDSVEEIVRNASGGLALKGIYYSMWDNPQTSIMPILEPPQKVLYWNAQTPYETGLRQFSEGHSAALFSKEVEESGFSHADSLYGFYGGFVAEGNVAYSSQTADEHERSTKKTTTSVSATNFCRCSTKCFSIPTTCFNLTTAACDMVLNITEKANTKATAKDEIRRFFRIYGSHVPYGVHQLGGLFFAMSTATSQRAMETSKMMHLNSSQLTTKVSAGFFAGAWGVGASDQHEQHQSSGSSYAAHKEDESIHYTYSVKSIGPHADNPASFKKALSTNNATWAILDRGDMAVNVPVWELIRQEGEKFKVIAQWMEETWKEDEKKRRERMETKETMSNLVNIAEVNNYTTICITIYCAVHLFYFRSFFTYALVIVVWRWFEYDNHLMIPFPPHSRQMVLKNGLNNHVCILFLDDTFC